MEVNKGFGHAPIVYALPGFFRVDCVLCGFPLCLSKGGTLLAMKTVVGIDEAGRGPLAGPLCVGCVAVRSLAKVSKAFPKIRDSKKLSPKQREVWFGEIKQLQNDGALIYTSVFVSARSIDARGMSHALKVGIARALSKISVSTKARVLLDGGIHAPNEFRNQTTIIKGDEKELPIALASIVAKVTRDAHMILRARQYPKYAFETHKGYGTRRHMQAIRKNGLSPIHRRTFCT